MLKAEEFKTAEVDAKEKARLARNAYFREYRKSHPEKVRESNQRYWLRKAQAQEKENND